MAKSKNDADFIILPVGSEKTVALDVESLDDVVIEKLENEYNDSEIWWEAVPKGFLALIIYCFGFALLSLIGLAVMAVRSSTATATATPETDDPVVPHPPQSNSTLVLCMGILIALCGSLQTASGYCSQRLGHKIDARNPSLTGKKHPLILTGLLLLAAGTIGAVVNLGLLGQSVTAPFAAMTLIINGVLACTVLKESITKYDVVATVMVLCGVGIAMVGVGLADIKVQKYSLADIEHNFFLSAFPLTYSTVLVTLIVSSFVHVKKNCLHSTPFGLCVFSVSAGLLSGFSSVCVKCTVEILKGVATRGSSDLRNPSTYLFVVGIPICIISQLTFMGLGLKHFGTLKFVPVYHAFIILSNLINGMVYFGESSAYNGASAACFGVGCVITISGVLLLLLKTRNGANILILPDGSTEDEEEGDVDADVEDDGARVKEDDGGVVLDVIYAKTKPCVAPRSPLRVTSC